MDKKYFSSVASIYKDNVLKVNSGSAVAYIYSSFANFGNVCIFRVLLQIIVSLLCYPYQRQGRCPNTILINYLVYHSLTYVRLSFVDLIVQSFQLLFKVASPEPEFIFNQKAVNSLNSNTCFFVMANICHLHSLSYSSSYNQPIALSLFQEYFGSLFNTSCVNTI